MRYLLLALSVPLFAAIDGTVINKTTSRPQPGVTVTLTKLGQGGMAPAGSVKTDKDGKFSLEGDAAGAHLLQASYQGVTYSMSLTPGSPVNGVELMVYDASRARGAAKVDQHMVLLETDGQELVVNETLIYKNDGTTTWANPSEGTLRFYLPEAAQSQMRVRALSPNGMPVERTPLKSGEKNVYYVDFPVKPGETRFDISYKMPATDPVSFTGRTLHKDGKVRLVVPQGIQAVGTGIKMIGTEPQSQATIYDVETPDYKVVLTGSGAMRALEPTQRTEEEGPSIEQIHPRIYGQMYWILGLSLALLALGFWSLYQRGSGTKA